ACGAAVRLAGAGPDGRGRGGRGGGTDGGERPVQAAALLRAELDRHLSRLLPPDGGEPQSSAQGRLDRRRRHDLGARHVGRRARTDAPVLGRALDAAPVPVRAAGAILADAETSARAPAGAVARYPLPVLTARSRALPMAQRRPTFAPSWPPKGHHPPPRPRVRPGRATTSFWSMAPPTSSAPITRCRR